MEHRVREQREVRRVGDARELVYPHVDEELH